MAAQYLGTNDNGEDMYQYEDGTQFTIPSNVFGAGMPVPDLAGDVQSAMPTPGIDMPPPIDPYAPVPEVTPRPVGPGAMAYMPKTPGPAMPEPGAPPGAPAPMAPKRPQPARPYSPDLADPGPMTDEYADAMNDATRQQEQGIDQSTEGAVKENQARAQGKTQLGSMMQADSQESLSGIEKDDAELARREGEIDGMINKFMTAKVDPDRYSKSMSDGQKVANLIAIGIGGFLSPLNNGKNPAMDMFERMIDRDIKAQEADLENLRAGVGAKVTMLGEARQRFASKQAAVWAVKAKMYDGFAMKAEGEADKYKDEQLRGNGMQLAALARQAGAEAQLKARQFETTERNQMAFQAKHLALGWAQLAAQKAAQQGKEVDVLGLYGPDGTMIGRLDPADPNNKERAKQWNQDMYNSNSMVQGYDELLKLYEEGANITDPAARARIEARAGHLLIQLKDAGHMGALDAGVQKFASTQGLGKPGWFYNGDNIAAIKEARLAHRQDMARRARVAKVPTQVIRGYGWEDPETGEGADGTPKRPPGGYDAPAGIGTPPPQRVQPDFDPFAPTRPSGPPADLMQPEEYGLPPQMQYTPGYDPDAAPRPRDPRVHGRGDR